jgi:hypothetical protein
MQGGKRRPVGVVADVVGLRALELELRVEACDLDHAIQPVLVHCRIGQLQEIVEIEEIRQQRGMDQQRRVDDSGSAAAKSARGRGPPATRQMRRGSCSAPGSSSPPWRTSTSVDHRLDP